MEIKEVLLWFFLVLSLVLNAVYLVSIYKESYRKSFEDSLTKLSNRKFLEEVMKMVTLGGDKYEVVFCDIDHFKNVNDTYGHDTGDKVLEITGHKLKSNFKNSKDHIIRYGGEEFLILLYKGNEKDIKEAILRRINELRMAIEATTLNIEEQQIKFTMSFGICYYDENIDFEDQIKKADEALYYSKNNGRNKVTVYKDNLS